MWVICTVPVIVGNRWICLDIQQHPGITILADSSSLVCKDKNITWLIRQDWVIKVNNFSKRNFNINIVLITRDVSCHGVVDQVTLFSSQIYAFEYFKADLISAHWVKFFTLDTNIEGALFISSVLPITGLVAIRVALACSPRSFHVNVNRASIWCCLIFCIVALEINWFWQYLFIGKFDKKSRQTLASKSFESHSNSHSIISQKVTIVGVLALKCHTGKLIILVKVSQTITSWLAKGSEKVGIWCVNKQISNVVRGSYTDIICSKVTIRSTISFILWVQSKHFIVIYPVSVVHEWIVINLKVEGDFLQGWVG